METLRQDVRFALRAFARRPGFSLSAILSLAIGIAASSAVFSLINAALFKPLPGVSRPERLVEIARDVGPETGDVTWEVFSRLRQERTVLEDVSTDSPLMQEEIFGPLLPILPVDDVGQAVRFVRDRDRPLALYVFSNDSRLQERVLRETSSGGALVNDTLVHLGNPDLPFGGVGQSGLGRYHGQASFDCFSHQKSVLKKPFALDVKVRYPPYAGKLRLLRRLLG